MGALEKETQLSQATVYRVLRKLADDEAVEKMRDTRPALYRLPQSPDQESSRERAQILTPRP